MTKQFNNVVESLYRNQFSIPETMQVLTHNASIYFSWGVSAKYNYNNKALVLKVNGHHHKGYVVITLDFNDTYIVNIINNRGKILNQYENVYFDELQQIIDERIEHIEEYTY